MSFLLSCFQIKRVLVGPYASFGMFLRTLLNQIRVSIFSITKWEPNNDFWKFRMDVYLMWSSVLIVQKDNFQNISRRENFQDQAGGTQFGLTLFKKRGGVCSSLGGPRADGSRRLSEPRTVCKREHKALGPADIVRRSRTHGLASPLIKCFDCSKKGKKIGGLWREWRKGDCLTARKTSE